MTEQLPPIGRAPKIVWLATAALGLLLVLWSVAVPAYRAPDEPQYLSTALRLATGGGYPHPGSATLLPEVANSYAWANFPGGDFRTFVSPRAVEQPQKGWPSFSTLSRTPESPDQIGQTDQMTQHPPLWPVLAAAEIDLLRLRHIPADRALLTLRLLQGLLLLPVPWLAWRAARLLRASRRASASVSFLPLLSPQFLHIGAGVTNGDLLLLELSVATVLLLRVALGDARRRVTVGLAGCVIAALLTKSFGLIMFPTVVVALLVRWFRVRDARALIPTAAVTFGIPVLLGGWWYVVRLVQDHTLQPSGYPAAVEDALAGHVPAAKAAREFLVLLSQTVWCDLGWFETPPLMRWVVPILIAVMAPVLWMVLRPWHRAPGPHRPDRGATVVALAPLVVLLAFVLAGGVSTWRHLHAVYGAQGRYLFPGLVGISGVLATAMTAPESAVVRRTAATVLPLGCLASAVLGLNLAVEHFWTHAPQSSLRTALGASPLPGALLTVVAAGAGLALLTAAGALSLGSDEQVGATT